MFAIFIRPHSLKQQEVENNTPTSENDPNEETVRDLVLSFGRNLRFVSLLAPLPDIKAAMDQYYAPFVSGELLDAWEGNPDLAPGRQTSSPYPARIDIDRVVRTANTSYRVEGRVIELTSEDELSGDSSAEYDVIFTVDNLAGVWRITSYRHDIAG